MSSHLEIFTKLFDPLVYHAPGSDASTQRALAAMGPLPPSTRILDMGCGAGRQTLQLASATRGQLIALDTSPHSLATLARRARKQNLASSIRPIRASMTHPCFPDGTFDVVWSEGAIYCIGFEAGLEGWRRLVKPGGFLAVTELTWLSANPPHDTHLFWNENYPAMRTGVDNRDAIARAGFDLIDEFTLPESDWWDHYYADLAKRLETFVEEFDGRDREIARRVVEQTEIEIETLRHGRGSYGYVFYIMRNPR